MVWYDYDYEVPEHDAEATANTHLIYGGFLITLWLLG